MFAHLNPHSSVHSVPSVHSIPLSCTSSPCKLLFLNLGVYGLVQATVGVGTVLIWDFRGGGLETIAADKNMGLTLLRHQTYNIALGIGFFNTFDMRKPQFPQKLQFCHLRPFSLFPL